MRWKLVLEEVPAPISQMLQIEGDYLKNDAVVEVSEYLRQIHLFLDGSPKVPFAL